MQNIGYLSTITETRAKVSSVTVSEAAHMLKVKEVLKLFIELLYSSVLDA